MQELNFIINGQAVKGTCPLGTTLRDFLSGNGVKLVSDLYVTTEGKLLSSAYELAHRWEGSRLTAKECSQEFSALVPEQLLSGTGRISQS